MRHRGAEQQQRDAEAGETLLEILITLILMGIAVIGILAGLLAATNLSSLNSRSTHAANTAQSYAEQLKQPIDAVSAAITYKKTPCPVTYSAFSGTLPTGGTWTATIDKIEYLNTLPSGAAGSNATFTSTCPGSADKGLQRLTVKVTSTVNGTTRSETVTIIKRDQSCPYAITDNRNLDRGPC